MSETLGSSPAVFLGLTVVLFGFAAFLSGQALAEAWRRSWQCIAVGFGLAVAARFLAFALFDGPLLSPPAFAIAWIYLSAVALFAWRAMLARKMVRQYPWLYAPAGPLGWRRLPGAPDIADDLGRN